MTITLDASGTDFQMQTEYAVLHRISYADYRRLGQRYADSRLPRLTFDRGTLEINGMNSDLHEYINRVLSTIVETLAEEWEREYANFGAMTLAREDLERGVEPDTCFYINRVSQLKEAGRVDLEDGDPAPDLVIEIDHTSPSISKLPIYAAFDVPEVWRWHQGTVTIFHLGDGIYQEEPFSLTFPALTTIILNGFTTQAQELPRLQWIRSLRRWVRNNTD